jgi:hypothetical protein
VTAFERPVTGNRGILSDSVTRLAELHRSEKDRWGDEPVGVFASFDPSYLNEDARLAVESSFGSNRGFADLRAAVRAAAVSQG